MKNVEPSIDAAWRSGPDRPIVPANGVDVWRIDLTGTFADAEPFLSVSERQRADRFLRRRDGLQFALSRAALRHILGRYVDRPPEDVAFRTGPGGKPRLDDPGAIALHYNLTHSHEMALCAVGRMELGVDIEWIRPAPMAAGIAAGIVSPDGPIFPSEIPSPELDWVFFTTWTRTEASLKAIGEGLSAIDRRTPDWIRSLSQPGATTPAGQPLPVVDLPVGDGYAAALAVIGAAPAVIRCWTWST